MKQNALLKLVATIIVIVGVFAAFIAPLAGSIRQGLDLQGGTHVVLEGVDTPEAAVNDDAMNRVVKIMEKRVKIRLLPFSAKRPCSNSKMKKATPFCPVRT